MNARWPGLPGAIRFTLALALLLAILSLTGCAGSRQVDQAIDRGAAYLASRQSEDGGWRSGVHGVFRDGTALTPHVLRALVFVDREPEAIARGRAWLATLDPDRLEYPVYGAADAAAVLSPSSWIRSLRARQIGGEGENTGGWAYPPGPGGVVEVNTSVTAYACLALVEAGATPDDPALQRAKGFLLRCRNDDGGFRFGASGGIDNKAGPGISYGTPTADAVRALLAMGVERDDPAVADGLRWLLERYDAEHVPGDYLPARAPLRDGNYFYFLDAATDAFVRAGAPRQRWASRTAEALFIRQSPDGSWRNELSAGREDDPLVATAFALRVLSRCR